MYTVQCIPDILYSRGKFLYSLVDVKYSVMDILYSIFNVGQYIECFVQ